MINWTVLGALTPRIAELEMEYFGFMWPNNASAGLRYGAGLDALGAALSGLSALPSLAGGSVAAPAMAAADVAANAGMSMMSAVMSATEQAATAVISPATSGASQAGSGGSVTVVGAEHQLQHVGDFAAGQGAMPCPGVAGVDAVAAAGDGHVRPAGGGGVDPVGAPAMPSSPPVQTMTPLPPRGDQFR